MLHNDIRNANTSPTMRVSGYKTCPVTFFVARSSREDVGVLAGRPRHDYCPQSPMIRGVMSPGPEGARDIANRGRAEVVGEAVRNVDAEL